MNPENNSATAHPPWYRQPWVWFVLGLPLVSVVVSLSLVFEAVKHKDDLVQDDWYNVGRMINQDIHADHLAQQLGLSGQVAVDGPALAVSVDLASTGAPVGALPDRLRLTLLHSTIATEDMIILVTRRADGNWHGKLPRLPYGKRQIALEPLLARADPLRWRLRATDIIFRGKPVAMQPEF